MALIKAALLLNPDRYANQMAALSGVQILHRMGDQLWVALPEEQASRLMAQGIIVQLHPRADLIELPALTFNPLQQVPEPPDTLTIPEPRGSQKAYYLVQFVAPTDPAWIHEIVGLGGLYVQNIPVHVSVFRLTAGQADMVAVLEYVQWVGLYQPVYGLHFLLTNRHQPSTVEALSTLTIDLSDLPVSEGGNVQLQLFDDANTDEVRNAISAAGATVVSDAGQSFIVQANNSVIPALLRVPGIFALVPFFPVTLANNRGGVIICAEQVRSFRRTNFLVNLDGSGEIVGVIDSGLDSGSPNPIPQPAPAPPLELNADLRGRVLEINNVAAPGNPVPDNDPQGPHGTHVTGTIAGNGTNSGGRIRGIAPASYVVFNGPLGPAAAFPDRTLSRAHAAGARVHNNSWGTGDVVTNNLYSVGTSDVLDQFCFTHPDSLVIFATHNHETDVTPAPGGDGFLDMNRLPYQSTAKNILAVGASESKRNDAGFHDSYINYFGRYTHPNLAAVAGGAVRTFSMSDNPDQVGMFSNRGRVNELTPGGGILPTGRVRPDLVAPGTNILSLRAVQFPPPMPSQPAPPTPRQAINTAPFYVGWTDPAPTSTHPNLPNFYMLLHGTSMATPYVSGAAILVRQYYRSRFGQLRRPQLLQGIAIPARTAPQPQLIDRPILCAHTRGLVMAWVTPTLAAQPKNIMALRLTRDLTQIDANPVQLQANVGNQPMPLLARYGNNTFLLHRASNNTLQLSLYDENLRLVTAFGTLGTVPLVPASRMEATRSPALCVHGDQVAIVWHETGTNNLRFQRLRADTGAAIDATPLTLGLATRTGFHPYIVHTGTHYGVVWTYQNLAEWQLQWRQVEITGGLVGTKPTTLFTQTDAIREPQVVWDSRGGRDRAFIVWRDEQRHSGGDIFGLLIQADGTLDGTAQPVITVSRGQSIRRPQITLHPESGYVLVWEDNSQNNHFDVYLTYLDAMGQPNRIPVDPSDPSVTLPATSARSSRRLLRISDTPEDTSGCMALTDDRGTAIIWQSPDEINSDQLGVYTLNVTPQGAFQAQADPNTPLINSGQYVNQVHIEHQRLQPSAIAMTWAGGSYFLLRSSADPRLNELHLVRTNGDALVDLTYGVSGTRTLNNSPLAKRWELCWTGNDLIAAVVSGQPLLAPTVYLFDQNGSPVQTFGIRGSQTITESEFTNSDISPQLGYYQQPAFQIVLAYGIGLLHPTHIRYTALDRLGRFVAAPRDLAPASGTARHGWFHVVNSVGHSIAIWHRQVGGNMQVFLNRFQPDGRPQLTQPHPIRLTVPADMPGDSRNAVVAPRPVAINSNDREYGVAWEYHPDPAIAAPNPRREICFSRLASSGQVMANPPVPAPGVKTKNVRVIFPGAPGSNPATPAWPPVPGVETDAIAPQLVSTLTHEPWADPIAARPAGTVPAWSPSYGLAWLGQPAVGGDRTLYFTVLDENGVRLQLLQPPPYGVGVSRTMIAPIVQVSQTGVDVQDFQLIWNGRVFCLTWTEIEGTVIRHRQTALTRQGSRVVYSLPSAALLKATLINGATNIANTNLPNVDQLTVAGGAFDQRDGYGWGRVNLRQSLAPSPPVTFQVRDDNAVGPGRTVRYRFCLPPRTALLRVTLNWTDPPGTRIVNNLHLRITTPAAPVGGRQVYIGNTWNGTTGFSRPFTVGTPFDNTHLVEQIVLNNPPAGDYDVEVIAEPFPANPFNQFQAQPFALVFVGSGPEVRFGGLPRRSTPFY